ncbi:Mu transposase C-terminal domain-containing protein [Mycolicibacterium fortuitum]|uniref:Mu transposase C-terminal domain-containing protein n=1 Tax=Mycolicibacterium fortuitum TaxID=1766 RepID=UPI001CE08D4B|nr:Mu transposase C-terminal domain-containing protein [Mycolicibacterium fortuitum]MCA4725234.1 Mu transposase C-terminal domain-containing protein [Mycolicibacterium fortuitum]
MIEIQVGDLIEFRCQTWQIRDRDAVALQLKCLDDGSELTLPIAMVTSDDTFVGPDSGGPSVADQRLLDLASPQQRAEAEFWYAHMFEVKYGISLQDRGILAPVEPTSPVASRLDDMRRHLGDLGITVSMATMWRKWSGFNRRGVVGCMDLRGMPGHVRLSGIDQRIEAVLDAVRTQFIDKSTPTKKQMIEIAKHRLTDENIAMPKRTSMYNLLEKLDRGEHITGDATARRSHANSPDRAFNKIVALFPGEEVQVDSTPLDAMVLLGDGKPGTVDLAAGIDVATGTILSPILRVNACKTVDVVEIWANSAIPQQNVPGWKENMAIARSYLPDVIASEEELNAALADKPLIDVRGLVVDRGKIFVSDTFLRAAEARGLNYRVAPPYTPTAKPHIERLLKTISDDFVRWIPGYKGRSVNHRGRQPEKDAVWPLPLLQALLDQWVIMVYQYRSRVGPQATLAPRMQLSPNAIYRALSQSAPTPARILTREEWICLHPCTFRVVNTYGINFENLIYNDDSPEFHRLRRRKSPNKKQNGRWEVRYDPNNLLQIWVRDESLDYDEDGHQIVKDNGWIECRWVLAKFATVPFGIDLVHAIKADVGKNISDKLVLERTEHIHRQLLGGPPQPRRRPLTRTETVAGRANLARQELRAGPPEPDARPESEQADAAAETTTAPAPIRVEPMRPMRLSEGW